MKRMLAATSIAALALIGSAGAAQAAPDANCFGQTHKTVNSGAVGVDNVGQLVQSLEGRGQGKKDLVYAVYC